MRIVYIFFYNVHVIVLSDIARKKKLLELISTYSLK